MHDLKTKVKNTLGSILIAHAMEKRWQKNSIPSNSWKCIIHSACNDSSQQTLAYSCHF